MAVRIVGQADGEAADDLEIAALEARLSTSRQAYARRPRIRTLSAVSAQPKFG